MDKRNTDEKQDSHATPLEKSSKSRTVEIKIALPLPSSSVQNVKQGFSKIPRKILQTGGVISAVIVVAFISYSYLASNHSSKLAAESPESRKPAAELQHGTPDYPTILPTGKTIESLGGWTRVSPPDRNPVFAYVDKIGASPITVSQQPLPDGFDVEADEHVEQLATGYKANEKIILGSTTIHIGTSAKGPQSVIFNKDKLLILIKSSIKIENDQWTAYVNSLQ